MESLWLDGVELKLVFNMAAVEDIEASFGSLNAMLLGTADDSITGWAFVEKLTALINGGLALEDLPSVSHRWVAARVDPKDKKDIQDMMDRAVKAGMMLTIKDLDSDKPKDLILEARKKKEPSP